MGPTIEPCVSLDVISEWKAEYCSLISIAMILKEELIIRIHLISQ